MKQRRDDPLLSDRARTMRRNPTPAERLVWSRVRRRQLGERVRRQEPIGQYIADFACISKGIVVEIDGDTHQDATADRARDDAMAEHGFRVLRFWNSEVYEDLDGVVESIAIALHQGHTTRAP